MTTPTNYLYIPDSEESDVTVPVDPPGVQGTPMSERRPIGRIVTGNNLLLVEVDGLRGPYGQIFAIYPFELDSKESISRALLIINFLHDHTDRSDDDAVLLTLIRSWLQALMNREPYLFPQNRRQQHLAEIGLNSLPPYAYPSPCGMVIAEPGTYSEETYDAVGGQQAPARD